MRKQGSFMSAIAKKLAELGITLPTPSVPVAAYVPYVITGKLVFISGQLPLENGQVQVTGTLGANVDLAMGQKAARLCALNILAHLKNACDGDLDHVGACVKLGGFVASAPGFFDQPKVMNGASELMQKIWGDAGRHSRFAVGVAALPLDAAVEVDAVFALR
jgi:enamine deaminase RidA (YjgF/YER057c/UK114 family)